MVQISEIPEKQVLSESDLWQTHQPAVWKAERFEGRPHFYPVYRWRDYYSYSPLLLAKLKGGVTRNPDCERVVSSTAKPYCPPDLLIDSEIRRLGGPPRFSGRFRDREPFLKELASALRADVRGVEERNPGHTNFILCGGKDSLNGLLLDWNNPTVVLSAEPNFELVREFVASNGLPFEVVRLEDDIDDHLIDDEIAQSFCRIDLQHGRWCPHLARLAAECGGKAVFWTGFMGDFYLSQGWMQFTDNLHPLNKAFRKRYRKWVRHNGFLRRLGWRCGIREDVERAFWTRGAAWQGNILGLYRAITGCLTVSLYHGPETAAVLHDADLCALSHEDLRPDLGYHLCGRRLDYPEGNPGPAPSAQRAGLWSVDRFARSLEAYGLPVIAV